MARMVGWLGFNGTFNTNYVICTFKVIRLFWKKIF